MVPLTIDRFNDINVGDRVYSFRTGDGTITNIDRSNEYNTRWLFSVSFDAGHSYSDVSIYNQSDMYLVGDKDSVRDPNLIPLANVPWDDLKIGDSLISAMGNPGKIVDKIIKDDGRNDKDYWYLYMEWENSGTVSMSSHWTLDRVLWRKDLNTPS